METQNTKLTRQERLRGKRNVDLLFEGGRGGFVYPFRYVWRVADASEAADPQAPVQASVLFAAPKRNHKRANVRNTLKRRTREAYRLNKIPFLEKLALGCTLHIALLYASKEIEEFKPIEDAVKKITSRIAAELGSGKPVL